MCRFIHFYKKFQKSLDKENKIIYNIKLLGAILAQLVEHILGKDEVVGSNPIDSSIYPANVSMRLQDFYF